MGARVLNFIVLSLEQFQCRWYWWSWQWIMRMNWKQLSYRLCRLFNVDNVGEVDQAEWALACVRSPMRVLRIELEWTIFLMRVLQGENWTRIELNWTRIELNWKDFLHVFCNKIELKIPSEMMVAMRYKLLTVLTRLMLLTLFINTVDMAWQGLHCWHDSYC